MSQGVRQILFSPSWLTSRGTGEILDNSIPDIGKAAFARRFALANPLKQKLSPFSEQQKVCSLTGIFA